MDFGDAIKSGFRNYVTFRGRAPRSEFWYWTLFAVLATLAGQITDTAILEDADHGLAAPLISLALFLPGWAVGIRRLHDIDRTGWWMLIAFTVVGVVADSKYTDVKEKPTPMAYFPVLQMQSIGAMHVELRTHGDPKLLLPSVQRLLAGIAPDLAPWSKWEGIQRSQEPRCGHWNRRRYR